MPTLAPARWTPALLALLVTVAAASCQQKSPPPPEKKQGAVTGGGTATGTATATGTTTSTGSSSSSGTSDDPTPDPVDLEIDLDDSAQELRFPVGRPLSVAFRISGAGSHEVATGLDKLTAGMRLETSSTRVTLTWSNPTQGTHEVRFLLRDVDRCEDEEGSSSRCKIDESDFGKLDKKRYDTLSQTFSLEIGSGGGVDPSTSGTAGLIAQIIGLLGQSGGGSGVAGALGNLDQNQLAQVLQMVQSGGGKVDIAQIIALVSSLSLKDQAPGVPASRGGNGPQPALER